MASVTVGKSGSEEERERSQESKHPKKFLDESNNALNGLKKFLDEPKVVLDDSKKFLDASKNVLNG